ncbi:6784_t:CDS:2 [Acaulospora morrowiae]|uniref:6784_t:CDS:1 n=1 Tax=Acaulospora morrowiae TaxID=94023 RepID=A0A9N9CLA0_9GLOM|nr:6784_t:CDS:2 [Acaulospora morrowiae]
MKLLSGKNDFEKAERILKHMCIWKIEDEKLNDLRSNTARNKKILINKIACEYIIENGINVDSEMLKGWVSELA